MTASPPSYSNIALMKAWLERDEDYAAAVVDCFEEFGAFEEYGSPTYYGIDLYALALWRRYPPTSSFMTWGERLWTALWQDIARWWHPDLRNLCGPYSRAYGMDMTRYVGLLGLWLPDPVVPSLGSPFEHSHDLTMAPLIALVGGGPAEVAYDGGERVRRTGTAGWTRGHRLDRARRHGRSRARWTVPRRGPVPPCHRSLVGTGRFGRVVATSSRWSAVRNRVGARVARDRARPPSTRTRARHRRDVTPEHLRPRSLVVAWTRDPLRRPARECGRRARRRR